MRTRKDEDLQCFQRGNRRRHLPHHVLAHALIKQIQEDDTVLGRSLKSERELPQLVRRHLPKPPLQALTLQYPVVPAECILPQVQLRRELLSGIQRKLQVAVKEHIWGERQ